MGRCSRAEVEQAPQLKQGWDLVRSALMAARSLAAGAAALNVYNNQDAVKALSQGDPTGGGVSVSITVGSSKSQSDS